jgi:hypothetical protein
MNNKLPKYFLRENSAYRTETEEGLFTRVLNFDLLGETWINKSKPSMEIKPEEVQEISEKQFKTIFCLAVAEIAGFEINSNNDLKNAYDSLDECIIAPI